jgi:predicted esterase
MRQTIAIISFVTCSVLCYSQSIDYKGFPEWSWGKQDSTEYYLYTPSNTTGKKIPLVLFLHGCCGEDNHATLRNAVDPPVRVWHNFGENQQSTPVFILSPKTKQGWKQHFSNIKTVIDNLIKKGLVDPQRIYISGFSMGAAGSWQFMEAYPDYFAAAIVMGMDFTGKDYNNFVKTPIWAMRGDQDWWARHLGTQVSKIRNLSASSVDSAEWITGVNPRLTNYEGQGHVIMWSAVNEPDYTSWMFSKINDGNRYPVILLQTPGYMQEFKQGETVTIEAEANDHDGSVQKVEFFLNGKKLSTITAPPYIARFVASEGDINIVAKVYDDKGKTSEASGKVWIDIDVNSESTTIQSKAGSYLDFEMKAKGNGTIAFSLKEGASLPMGLQLSPSGSIHGVPVNSGSYSIRVVAIDQDGDKAESEININVGKKSPQDVIVKNVRDYKGKNLPVSVVKKGITPHIRTDKEVTFSEIPKLLNGATLIQTEVNDTTTARPFYLEFETDEPVTVYVAYEKLDKLLRSTIPSWLTDFKKEQGQIVTQYFYYEVYSKDFPKGKITLPDAEGKSNGVNTNYFVMVKRKK